VQTSKKRRIDLGELDDPVVVDLPLRGEWSVERTPAHRIPSHGTDFFGQRFAYDFVRTDGRAGLHVHPAGMLRWSLIGGRTQDCYGWGEPVHAALDGEIVAAVDGIPERQWIHTVRETLVALNSGVRLARGRLDPIRLAGNYVIIRTATVYALYAHLAPGSVAVETGKVVRVGAVIGRVGHSGNSTAPHLHLQLMDAADPLHASGIPCAFAEYLVQRDVGWERVERGIPRRLQRIRSVV
jgi:Peptidase family M23